MQRERVADDIYVFTSEQYAQVTAGAVVTDEGTVLIDTLTFPEETREIKRFIENRLRSRVKYVINTHFHADHTTGTYIFEDAIVIAHVTCRDLLDQRGRESLERIKTSSPDMREVELVLPHIVFDRGQLRLVLGGKTLTLWHTPGHSPDSMVCQVDEDRILFGADTIMPLPYFVDGSFDDFIESLSKLRTDTYEHIVQGHGEVILRGEIDEKISSDLAYLDALRQAVRFALDNPNPEAALAAIDIEDCGKNRILLNGMVEQLHQQNVQALARQYQKAAEFSSSDI